MKKMMSLCIAIVTMFVLSACGNTTEPEEETNVNSENVQEEQETDGNKTRAEKVSEQLITYTDSFGDPQILYLAVVKNTDTVPLEFGSVTIDINDSNNNLLKHLDYGSVYPQYIMPGEVGYICEGCTQLDENIDLNSVASAEMHFGTRAANYTPPDVEITQLQLKEATYGYSVLGKVKGNESIEDLMIAFPISDNEGNLQTVALASVETLNASEERGFECSPMFYDPNIDFSTSTVQAISYTYK